MNHERGAWGVEDRVVAKQILRGVGPGCHDCASESDSIDAIDRVALNEIVRGVHHPDAKHSRVAEPVVLDGVEISILQADAGPGSESARSRRRAAKILHREATDQNAAYLA